MRNEPAQLRAMRPSVRIVWAALHELGHGCRVKDLAVEAGLGIPAVYRALDALHAARLIPARRWRKVGQKCIQRDTQPLKRAAALRK